MQNNTHYKINLYKSKIKNSFEKFFEIIFQKVFRLRIFPYLITQYRAAYNTTKQNPITNILKNMSIIGFSEFVNGNKEQKIYYLDIDNSITIKTPKYISRYPRNFINAYVRLPDLYYAELQNVTVIGRTEFILYNNRIISDELAYYDYTHYVLKSSRDILSLNSKKLIKFAKIPQKQSTRTIERAIHLLHEYSCNYYHFLIEVIPRILILNKIKINNIPILIDDNLPDQFYEALNFYTDSSYSFIKINKHEYVEVKKLIYPSFLSICHDLPVDKIRNYERDFVISPHAILFLNNFYFSKITIEPPFKKIFIDRTNSNHGRSLININEIKSYAESQGYEIISPEKLSFKEQVQLFSSAKNIISIGGAALTNLVFCQKNTKVLMMSHDYVNGNPYIFSTIADVLNLDLKILYGYALHRYDKGSNFKIPLDEFILAFDHLEN